MTTKVHKILFDLEKRRVQLQAETDKKDWQGEAVFEPIRAADVHSSVCMAKKFGNKKFLC